MKALLLLIGFIFASVHFAEAQQQSKLAKIGWLGVAPIVSSTGIEFFRRELRDLGYIEGKNITIEVRSADNMLDRLSILADELARLKLTYSLSPRHLVPSPPRMLPEPYRSCF